MQKIKKGDMVVLNKGKDRGRTGLVLSVRKTVLKQARVLVEGLNLVKRHLKPTQERSGGIVEQEASIAIANVAIWNQTTAKADRVGFKILEDGSKVRIFKSTGEVLDA